MTCDEQKFFTCLTCASFPEFESETAFIDHVEKRHKCSSIKGRKVRSTHIDYRYHCSDDTEWDCGAFRYYESNIRRIK